MERLKVYYNSACPVCKAGIEDQQCRMRTNAVVDVEWLDVHQHPELAHEIGTGLESVREQLHVRSVDGSMRIGAEAFAALFHHTRGQQWLGKVLELPVIRQLTQLVYRLFARGLYRWNRFQGRW